MLKELILRSRSYRRFDQKHHIEPEILERLVDLARLSPSGANMQPLKYVLSSDPRTNALIFPTLAWAGYLKEWTGPKEGERPAAYIIILQDTDIKKKEGCDHGIAAQSILLGATEFDLGGCIIGSIKRDELRKILSLEEKYSILLVLALGKPAETVRIESASSAESIEYWRDEAGVHHVPKRSLEELIIGWYKSD